MTFFDWLNGPDGHALIFATVAVLNGLSYYLWFLSHKDRVDIRNQLDGHMQQHVNEALDRQLAEPDTGKRPSTTEPSGPTANTPPPP